MKGGEALGDVSNIYDRYANEVFKYLMCLCRDFDLAEELTQETFYQAVKSIHRYNGECKMSVWLCQIAKQSYYKYVEKNKKQQILQSQESSSISPETKIIKSEDKISLFRQIHQLDEPYKEVILLRTLGELSFREIGEVQGKNENWARVTFYRAKLKLKEGGNESENEV